MLSEQCKKANNMFNVPRNTIRSRIDIHKGTLTSTEYSLIFKNLLYEIEFSIFQTEAFKSRFLVDFLAIAHKFALIFHRKKAFFCDVI